MGVLLPTAGTGLTRVFRGDRLDGDVIGLGFLLDVLPESIVRPLVESTAFDRVAPESGHARQVLEDDGTVESFTGESDYLVGNLIIDLSLVSPSAGPESEHFIDGSRPLDLPYSVGKLVHVMSHFVTRSIPPVDDVVLLSAAVGLTVYYSPELMALDGVVMTIQGVLLMMLAVALKRWADHG